jgi:hypothetical protein
MSFRFVRALAVPTLLLASPAFADETSSGTSPPAAAPPGATDADARKTEAKEHFDRGIALLEDGAWDAALAEFLRSRTLFPTRAATKDAGICLGKLHRFDEAIDLFEALLREFPDLPADERVLVETQIKELSRFVGSIDVEGAEAGAQLVVDGRARGTAPSPALRVSAGTHVLRVSREGFAPYERQVSVAGGESTPVPIKLEPLVRGGRLHVEEATGQAMDVLVDGAIVGKTPWDGMLPVGDHVIALAGEGNLGTPPALASIRANTSTPLHLRAEALTATLRIRPTPPGASVILDGVPIGNGAWSGRVRAGAHLVEVRAEGFVTEQQRSLAPGDRDTLIDVRLRRREAVIEHPGNVFVEADGGPTVAPSLGGDLTAGCSGGCSAGTPFGFQVSGHAGYQLFSGLGFALDAGFLSVQEKLEGRPVTLTPQGLSDNHGTATDALTLSGLTVGASAEYHGGERFIFVGRLGVGGLFGSLKDERSGSATTNDRTVSGAEYPALEYSFSSSESPAARYLYLAPEFRAGVRLTSRFEVTLGLRALVLIGLTQPRWSNENPISPGAKYHVGELRFAEDSLAGNVLLVLAPTLGARFDF